MQFKRHKHSPLDELNGLNTNSNPKIVDQVVRMMCVSAKNNARTKEECYMMIYRKLKDSKVNQDYFFEKYVVPFLADEDRLNSRSFSQSFAGDFLVKEYKRREEAKKPKKQEVFIPSSVVNVVPEASYIAQIVPKSIPYSEHRDEIGKIGRHKIFNKRIEPKKKEETIYDRLQKSLDTHGINEYLDNPTYKSLEDANTKIETYSLPKPILYAAIYHKLQSSRYMQKFFFKKYMQSYIEHVITVAPKDGIKDLLMSFYDKEVKQQVNINNWDVLKPVECLLNWDWVHFGNGKYTISQPNDGSYKFSPLTIGDSRSLESFNYIKEFFKTKLPDIHCRVERMTIEVLDSVDLSQAIRTIASESRQRAIKMEIEKEKLKKLEDVYKVKGSFSFKFSSEHPVTAEQLRKYKSRYINALLSRHDNNYRIIPCSEHICHTNNDSYEQSFMFTIQSRNSLSYVIIAVENLNWARATLMFKVRKSNYEYAIKEIHSFLQGPEINKRSNMRDTASWVRDLNVSNFAAVDHKEGAYAWSRMFISKINNL